MVLKIFLIMVKLSTWLSCISWTNITFGWNKPTDRVGFYRFIFILKKAFEKILLNLGGHVATSTMINAKAFKTADNEISGYFDTAGRVWGGVDKARVYFVVQFERPFETLNSWKGAQKQWNIEEMEGDSELKSVSGSSFKQSLTSGVEVDMGEREAGDQVLLKASVSYVSIENARENIMKECKHWDFDGVKQASCDIWNEWFGKIDVNGGEYRQKIKFYTDLWHVLLGRHMVDDSNGQYPLSDRGKMYWNSNTCIHTINPEFHAYIAQRSGRKLTHHMYNSDALWLTNESKYVMGMAYPSVF